MPLATQFIEPAGELSPEDFPGTNLLEWLPVWQERAFDDDLSEHTQEAHVYTLAYESILRRFNREAASQKEGDVSSARRAEQYAYWLGKRDEWRREFTVRARLEKGDDGVPGPLLTAWA